MRGQINKTPPLPFPEKKRTIQAEVNEGLFNAIEKEIGRRGLSIRKVVEWGFSTFLLNTNPNAAERLGISIEEEK